MARIPISTFQMAVSETCTLTIVRTTAAVAVTTADRDRTVMADRMEIQVKIIPHHLAQVAVEVIVY